MSPLHTRLAAVASGSLLVLLVSSPASGQPGTGTSGLARLKDSKPTIQVTLAGGETYAGRLVSFEGTQLTMQANAVHKTFDLGEVARVQRRGDSLKSGTIIGAIVGFSAGLVLGTALDTSKTDTGSHPQTALSADVRREHRPPIRCPA